MPISYIDPRSPYDINFVGTRDRPEIMGLGRKFVAQEQTLPVEEQTTHTPRIINLLEQLIIADTNRIEAERQRSMAADELQRIEKQIPSLIKQMWKAVTLHYPDQPSMATNWGFKMKGSTRNVLLPKTRAERRATLAAYIKYEESRPEAERFSVPDLNQIVTIQDEWEYNLARREKAVNQRETNVNAGNEMTYLLALYLQAGAIHILGERFAFKVSPEMQNWGFDVSLKRTGSANGSTSNGAEAPASSTEEPTTNGSGTVEGTLEAAVDVNGSSGQ